MLFIVADARETRDLALDPRVAMKLRKQGAFGLPPPGFLPWRRRRDAVGDRGCLRRERGVELLRPRAVARHANVEALLDLEVADVPKLRRKLVAVVDERRHHDSVRMGGGSQAGLPLPIEHVAQLVRT